MGTMRKRTGTATNLREGEGGGIMNPPPYHDRSRVEGEVLPSRKRHNRFCQKMALAGSQRLRAQDPAPVRHVPSGELAPKDGKQ